jgi:hypothetical protein
MATGKKPPAAQKAPPPAESTEDPAGRKNVAAALARRPTRKVAREMLVLELRRLRAMFSEIAERYVANTEGEIVAVIEAIEGKPLAPARVAAMLKLVRDLTVKPRKGRRKDLARIENVAALLRKELGG